MNGIFQLKCHHSVCLHPARSPEEEDPDPGDALHRVPARGGRDRGDAGGQDLGVGQLREPHGKQGRLR